MFNQKLFNKMREKCTLHSNGSEGGYIFSEVDQGHDDSKNMKATGIFSEVSNSEDKSVYTGEVAIAGVVLHSSLSLPTTHEESSKLTTQTSLFHSSINIGDLTDARPKNLHLSDISSLKKVQKLNEALSTNNMSDSETEALNHSTYLEFLDDFVRFDISRTGISCFSGYSVSVQYEDDFLVGKAGMPCYLNMICSNKSRVRLWRNEKSFQIEYQPKTSCTKPKNCMYQVKMPHEEDPLGTIHFKKDRVHIYNAFERCISVRRKQGSNFYLIKSNNGDRLASVELFRGLRGDILYYGLSILGDVSATDKALFIGLTIAMDVRQKESEMRCSLIWIPLCCIVIVGLFSIVPWLYFYDDTST